MNNNYKLSMESYYYLNNYLNYNIIEDIEVNCEKNNTTKIYNYINIYNYLQNTNNYNVAELFFKKIDEYFNTFFDNEPENKLNYKLKLIFSFKK